MWFVNRLRNIPSFIHISDGKMHEVNILDQLLPEPGAFYVLVAIVKKRLHINASLYEMLQILSLTMFEKIPLDQLLAQTVADQIRLDSGNQLFLFE